MASTTTDDGFHEIQLNGKQLVFLFMAVTVVSVVIFLCGVLVGRGVPVDRAAAPIEAQAATVVPPVPPSVTTTGSGAPASASEDLDIRGSSVRKRTAVRAAQGARCGVDAAASASPGDRSARAAARSANGREARAYTGGRRCGARDRGTSRERLCHSARRAASARGSRHHRRRLVGKGFPAYVLSPESGAPAVFRVRVGKFKDRREAETVAARLQKEEQFNPWIVR